MAMGTSNSESLFDRLGEDVIQLILRDLPVKTLGRCITLSKSFASIISSSSFIYSLPCTASPSCPDASVMFVDCYPRSAPLQRKYLWIDCKVSSGSSGCKDYSCPTSVFGLNVAGGPKLKVAGACKGLICLRGLSGNRLLLWNPLIKRFFILPKSGFDLSSRRYLTRIGLGFDSKDNDYKVLMVPYSTMPRPGDKVYRDRRDLYLYSLKFDSWKAVGSSLESLPTTNEVMTVPLVFAGGSLHFLEGSELSITIVAFDMGDRTLRRISIPTDAKYTVGGMSISEYERRLSISEYDGGSSIVLMAAVDRISVLVIDVYKLWVMKEYGVEESWVKLTLGDSVPLTRVSWFRQSDYIWDEFPVGQKYILTESCDYNEWIYLRDLLIPTTKLRLNDGYRCTALNADSLALLDKRRTNAPKKKKAPQKKISGGQ